MATASPDFQSVLDELGRTLRGLRQDCPPMETGRVLLSYDGPGRPLVGDRRDGERTVYFDERSRRAIIVCFGAGRLGQRGGRPIASLAATGVVEGWIERMQYDSGRRHPRYR